MKIKTRKQAILDGDKQYFTGKPCKEGHLSPIHVSGGCTQCRNLYSKKYQEENKEKISNWHKQNHLKKYSTENRREIYIQNNVAEMYQAAKTRAKRNGLSFTITKEDVIIPKQCPVFGIELDRRDKQHVPTLDRIDNNLGYIKGNVEVISSKANRLKNNGTIEDFELILQYMMKKSLAINYKI
jgi:hypothetical protein